MSVDVREYINLFPKPIVIGRLYLYPSFNTSGATFKVFVTPLDATFSHENVLVFSEKEGWIHDGKWKQDFEKLVKDKKDKKEQDARDKLAKEEEQRVEKQQHDLAILATYK